MLERLVQSKKKSHVGLEISWGDEEDLKQVGQEGKEYTTI